ncbi:putative quorum-sensing-regulated virulence factor [Xylophilus ampelinus]|uniref:Uncharacterized protein (DUF3820 family) n=1 Tax=Xylophilus ampelinus TaxID=54067 RepID=A0A318SKN7_9BURK|nr:DUF3820 family protein [Xylophilus ampelinus]PYE76341.1 uncharacterized protein (DUF3820 family) [Xylophilus ampelinus]
MKAADLQTVATREIPVGKHRGCPIANLPAHYPHWFTREGFRPGRIGRLPARMFELGHNGPRDLPAPLRPARPHGDYYSIVTLPSLTRRANLAVSSAIWRAIS